MTTANELRQMFLDYFEKEHGHRLVASAPLVPPDDPSLLFSIAGMVQFKPLYAGTVKPLPYTRATSCQKCVRVSDLENVGKTLRHHTFFEMLGNFSFGDYFKSEAMLWGWDFIWNHMKLPKERLWATTFEEDDEAESLLEEEVGIPRSRIIPLNAKENFWGPAGQTGACGPCSEICFFMGDEKQLREAMKQDCETIARRIVEEGDLFLEIWNMVFPQFDQQLDGSRPPLKNRGIDTGAGLERMATALQFIESGGKIASPFQMDLFAPMTRAAAALFGMEYHSLAGERDNRRQFFINAIADHARALTFALSEGVVPSNEGRGYVLRRILRRALRFGYLLGAEEPFLHKLVEVVVGGMGGAYPEIKERPDHVAHVIRIEEERFIRTVAQGTKILDERIARLREKGETTLTGDDAFLLHATYGFPVDMTAEILEDAKLDLDRPGYQRAMKGHQEDARKSWKGGGAGGAEEELLDDVFDKYGETEFRGYEGIECEARVVAILSGGTRVDETGDGQEALVALEETPFYAESGGQVGDTGILRGERGEFVVTDTRKTASGLFLHVGKAKGTVRVDDTVRACVDAARRMAIRRNHTATHLLQAALKQVVGKHITQSGSFVGPDGMRFDFSHTQACAPEELERVERMVNEFILSDLPVCVEEMPIEDARKRGAIAPFGEKYGHRVRVVEIGTEIGWTDRDTGQIRSPSIASIPSIPVHRAPPTPRAGGTGRVSLEFCGGTHLDRTGQIASFRLVAEASVAAGIRRIEGVTGQGAYEAWAATRDAAGQLCHLLAVKEDMLMERVAALQDEIKKLNKEIKRVKQAGRSGGASIESLIAGAREISGLKVIAARIEEADAEQLRQTADQLREKVPNLVCVLGSVAEGKVSLLCAVSKDATKRIKAGDVIKQVAAIVGGGGGGRPDLAQAGGKNPEKLDEAVAQAPEIIQILVGKSPGV